ncbi:unnamed protein product [Caenorhabditis brenneri]
MIRQESSEFLRQKQAQWEKEKAESKSRPEWFPFGENSTPGGGSPLRKFVSKEPVVSICPVIFILLIFFRSKFYSRSNFQPIDQQL